MGFLDNARDKIREALAKTRPQEPGKAPPPPAPPPPPPAPADPGNPGCGACPIGGRR